MEKSPVSGVDTRKKVATRNLSRIKDINDYTNVITITSQLDKPAELNMERNECQKKTSKSLNLRRIFGFSSNSKPKRSKDTDDIARDHPYLDNEFLEERLVDIDLAMLVTLPPYIELNEWLAAHTYALVENINLIYGCVSEYCIPAFCKSMTGPHNTKYIWIDERGRKCKCSAPRYIDYVLTFCHRSVRDEQTFPTKYGNTFPPSFSMTVRKINRLLLHILAHLYHVHTEQIQRVRMSDCLNTVAYHLLVVCKRFQLVDEKELSVLDDLYHVLQCKESTTKSNINWLCDTTNRYQHSKNSLPQDLPFTSSTSINSQYSNRNKENMVQSQYTVVPIIAYV